MLKSYATNQVDVELNNPARAAAILVYRISTKHQTWT